MSASTITVGELRASAGRVLSEVAVRDVSLHTISANRSGPPSASSFTVTQDVRVRGEQSDDRRAVTAWAEYQVAARPSDPSSNEEVDPSWSVSLELVATYAVTGDSETTFSPDELEAFSLVIGLMTIHPYAREAIQSTTARLGYPPFTLELLTPISAGADEDVVDIDSFNRVEA